MIHISVEERFWSKVQRGGVDECWPWTKECNSAGYGRFRLGRVAGQSRSVQAHRFAAETATGERIGPGLLILHSCDNPPCCNPAHLRPGTAKDNAADAIARGRLRPLPYEKQQRGSERPAAVLTEEDIPEIRMRLRRGDKQRDIAAAYGVTQNAIKVINLRKGWSHVPDLIAPDTEKVKTRELQPCGTAAGYQRHRKRGEKTCPDCKAAMAAYKRDRDPRRRHDLLPVYLPTPTTNGAAS
jgi:hypothetical protein